MKSFNGRLFRIMSTVHQKRTNDNESDMDTLKENVDALFLIVMGCIVFFMQCGFALLEAGSVRYFQKTSLMIQNHLSSIRLSFLSFS